ncbi:MAG: M48 family metallopeptidase [Ignavibacteriae bacterium]|nr:M48 family metallopeptidase [Ignavibacteriota bacterium]
MHQIEVESISIEITRKKIKNIHLRVYPPLATVKISAPLKMDIDAIRTFAVTKLDWIKQHRSRMLGKERESQREFISGESHYFLGKSYVLEILESNEKPSVSINEDKLVLRIKPDISAEERESIVHAWYRAQLKILVPQYFAKWEGVMNVKVNEFGIKKMKTKWGTCNVVKKRIWVNLELAKKSLDCLEYLVVHEMVHLLERSHNHRFVAFMDKFLPDWRVRKAELNRYSVRQDD